MVIGFFLLGLFVGISGYLIGGYSWILMVFLLIIINNYSIMDIRLMVIILMAIGGYSINVYYISGYW